MEEYLNRLKSEYEKTEATWHLRSTGWEELERRIGFLEAPGRFVWLRNFAVAFAVFLVFLFSTYKIALASLPGDLLYPVKLITEQVIQKTSGSNQIVIDHRADEIIGLSRQQEVKKQELREAVIEYKESVSETKKIIQDSGERNPEFQQKLSEQHKKFDQISRENPEIEKEIKGAVDVSDHSEGHD